PSCNWRVVNSCCLLSNLFSRTIIACSRRHVMLMPNWASILNQLVIRFDNGLPLILNQLQRLLTDSVFAVGSTYTESNTRGVRCNLQQRTPSSRLRVIIQLT